MTQFAEFAIKNLGENMIKLNKKKTIIIISALLLVGTSLFLILDKEDRINYVFKYKSKITIEAGDNIPTMNDYLYRDVDKEKEIVWNNIDIIEGKVYKVGTYSGKFNYDNKERKITLVVKDTTSPVISGVNDVEVLAFEKVPDFISLIDVSDNSKEEVSIKVDGKYNIEETGEYNLTYIATDKSSNETKKKFKLIVKENKNITTSESSLGYTIKNDRGITYINDVIIVNKTYSLPSSFAPNNLEDINGYIKVVDFVKEAFLELTKAGQNEGVNIYASSGYRTYKNEEYIYEGYVNRKGITYADAYFAKGGYSEHQTGLAIDVNIVDTSFENTKESNWLRDNSYKYGFIIRYPSGKENITGYSSVPWHIRYVGKKLAKELYNNGNYLTIEEYFGIESKYA